MAKIDVYCDECRQDLIINKQVISSTNRYIVLGGIWIEKEIREEFKNQIKELKNKYKVFGEIKWKNVSSSKLEFYKEIIETFFRYDSNQLSFRALVIDAQRLDIEKYHNNSAELGFYKFYYQLLKNWLHENNTYNIFLDYRKDKSKSRAYDLKTILNKEHSNENIENIQFLNSKESLLLQIEDVIMGAVGYKYNYEDKGQSIAKSEIIDIIEKYHSFNKTNKDEPKFNIFKIKLGGENT